MRARPPTRGRALNGSGIKALVQTCQRFEPLSNAGLPERNGRVASALLRGCSGVAPVLLACCPLGWPLGSAWVALGFFMPRRRFDGSLAGWPAPAHPGL